MGLYLHEDPLPTIATAGICSFGTQVMANIRPSHPFGKINLGLSCHQMSVQGSQQVFIVREYAC